MESKTNEPTTGEIVEVLRENGDVYFGETEITCDQIADRLESQEQKIAEIENFHKEMLKDHKAQVAALTARAEQAENDFKLISGGTKNLCDICRFVDLIGCCHKNHCDDNFSMFQWRGLPQDGEGV